MWIILYQLYLHAWQALYRHSKSSHSSSFTMLSGAIIISIIIISINTSITMFTVKYLSFAHTTIGYQLYKRRCSFIVFQVYGTWRCLHQWRCLICSWILMRCDKCLYFPIIAYRYSEKAVRVFRWKEKNLTRANQLSQAHFVRNNIFFHPKTVCTNVTTHSRCLKKRPDNISVS